MSLPEGVILTGQVGYPESLADLDEPPRQLYYRGDLAALIRAPMVAVVGTRRATPSGLRAARELSRDLARAGVSVLSGLARGIDGEAHRGCLEAEGAAPVAVVGCGLDRVYPAEHAWLHQQVAERGIVLSEYPPGTPPLPHHFPARNRIVAALSKAVLVIQAPTRSGALLTARLAEKLQRNVLVVPGPPCSSSDRGTLELLREGGATLALDVMDVLVAMGYDYNFPKSTLRWEPLLSALEGRGATLDELCRLWNWPVHQVLAQLCDWEVEGLVRLDGAYYARAS